MHDLHFATTPKRGSSSPQLKGPHQSVGVHRTLCSPKLGEMALLATRREDFQVVFCFQWLALEGNSLRGARGTPFTHLLYQRMLLCCKGGSRG